MFALNIPIIIIISSFIVPSTHTYIKVLDIIQVLFILTICLYRAMFCLFHKALNMKRDQVPASLLDFLKCFCCSTNELCTYIYIFCVCVLMFLRHQKCSYLKVLRICIKIRNVIFIAPCLFLWQPQGFS